ncbi:uncharacterized protein LOC115427383 [Sphaeramia orbicularis]|uniref:uncharacterized protein LOC115427383 n=1 Tax=Sphaeramia orbicularis TaxID=375764 RepID=UPI00117EF846|nr:uncharacterized protein LOC115427383 [Sphaeramia orbicularis]
MLSAQRVQWFKQSVGNTMKFIVSVEKNIKPQYSPDFSESRIAVHIDGKFSNLTILRTNPEDEGMYHCGIYHNYMMNTWNGTYLSLKGKTASDYTVVQRPTVSDPLRPGDSMSLQCSLLSNSDKKTCPGDHSVYWVRVGSHESDPGVIYAEGNRQDGCNNDTQSSPKSCLHHFSKTIHSSDAGTYYYYCAVATCGRILFGNGTRIQIETSIQSQKENITFVLLCTILSLCLSVITFYICSIMKGKGNCCSGAVTPDKISPGQKSHHRCDDTGIYSAAVFTVVKSGGDGGRKGKLTERQKIYAAVKAFGLD